jgi:methylenetetrahydrofolate reductase (NADPH)
MKVVEHLEGAKNPIISVEIIPPRRGKNILKIHDAIESILPYQPKFIDVTSHSAEVIWEELPGGAFRRRVKRKSPGTFGLCAAIKYKFNIDPVPHILCGGFTREETEDALIELNYLGVENLLLIRGDDKLVKTVHEGRTVNVYAMDLVQQVHSMNQGRYLDDLIDAQSTGFCIGVAAYPEKHFEAPNLKFGIDILLQKQLSGAHYAVCQMFYDNTYYYDFVKRAREAGVTIPILPGLKILTKKDQLSTIPAKFYTTFPDELVDEMMQAKTEKQEYEIGLNWAYRQAIGLLEYGCNNLHFYIMQNTTPFVQLMERLKGNLN